MQGGDDEYDGITAMTGTLDMAGQAVLLMSYLNEPHVRLYNIPDFTPRGTLTPVSENHIDNLTSGHAGLTM